jgi:DNA-binding cell septation regulator SpoVG
VDVEAHREVGEGGSMSNKQQQQRRRLGKAYLAGSSFNSEPTAIAQKPILPTNQLKPNRAEILVGSENLGVRKRPPKVGARTREQNGLTRRDIARLIVEHPATAKNLPDAERALLVNIGQGNVTLEQAAASMKMDVLSLNVLLDGPERQVILGALHLRLIKPKKGKGAAHDSFDITKELDDRLVDKDIEIHSGETGFFVADPKRRTDKPQQPGVPYRERFKERSDFNTAPTTRTAASANDSDRTGGDVSGSDDYGEESGA